MSSKKYHHLVVHLPNPENGNAMEVWGTYQEEHKTFGKFENDELIGWIYKMTDPFGVFYVFVNTDGHPTRVFGHEKGVIEWLGENTCSSLDYLPARQKVSEEDLNDTPETAQSKHMD